MNITVTDDAVSHLMSLLESQDDTIGVRMFVESPGTPRAESVMMYCKETDDNDIIMTFGELKIFVDKKFSSYLDEARINFEKSDGVGNLTIKTPNAKVLKIDENSSLEEKVNHLLWNVVNPELAAHGGEVSLVEITKENVAIISFGGGCQGCAQVDLTLKHGVEQQLMDSIPDLSGVRDITDHSDRSNAYY